MSSEPSRKRSWIYGSIITVCFIAIAILIGYFTDSWEGALTLFVLAGLGLVITILYSTLFYIKKLEIPNINFELISILDIDKEEQNTEDKRNNTDEKVYYYVERISNPPKEENCRISLRSIEKEREAIQCLFCKSFFIEDYLKRWLLEDEICSVCKAVLMSSFDEIENT
ncbi:MAG: hypothetical protein HZR80_10290 [Candidatus Heimdallarchaeota archaeon]